MGRCQAADLDRITGFTGLGFFERIGSPAGICSSSRQSCNPVRVLRLCPGRDKTLDRITGFTGLGFFERIGSPTGICSSSCQSCNPVRVFRLCPGRDKTLDRITGFTGLGFFERIGSPAGICSSSRQSCNPVRVFRLCPGRDKNFRQDCRIYRIGIFRKDRISHRNLLFILSILFLLVDLAENSYIPALHKLLAIPSPAGALQREFFHAEIRWAE